MGGRGDGRHQRGRGSVPVEGDKGGYDDVGKRGSVKNEVIKFAQSELKKHTHNLSRKCAKDRLEIEKEEIPNELLTISRVRGIKEVA